jgi:FkbM family methyltransferase
MRIQDVFKALGFCVLPYRKGADPSWRSSRIKESLQINVALDVGANSGQFGGWLRGSGFDGKIISFEPTSSAFCELQKRAAADNLWECRNIGLGEEKEAKSINLSGNSVSSSFLPMLKEHVQIKPDSAYSASEQVEIETLDNLFDELVAPGSKVWLKIDTQGYEMNVLRGASKVLSRIHAIQVEASLKPLYEGETSAHELIGFLQSKGFEWVGIEPGLFDSKNGHLLQADLIFVQRQTPNEE